MPKKKRSKVKEQHKVSSKKLLRRGATESLVKLGHAPGPWIHSPSGHDGEARAACKHCGAAVVVNFASGEIRVDGQMCGGR